MSKVKLCKNCKYFKRDWIFWRFNECTRLWTPAVNPVNGKNKVNKQTLFCDSERDMAGRFKYTEEAEAQCGPTARFFKAKKQKVRMSVTKGA